MNRLVAIYRHPRYSPLEHLTNDSAILATTAAQLSRRGWRVSSATEAEVERGALLQADLYLNMCQGARASERLETAVPDGARIVNRPTAVVNCHRHRLVHAIIAADIPFPPTLLTPTTPSASTSLPIDVLTTDHDPIWIKRGDVHAERPEDVVVTDRDGVDSALAALAGRGVEWAVLQANIPGPVVKFYGIIDGRFFRWYPAASHTAGLEVDEDRLRTLAWSAAHAVGLEIFGGDVALPAPDKPVLIDLNDWPSFARFRQPAALAIAGYIDDSARNVGGE